ncbi:MAG TPA: nuclear transport factor 2 family protein, partial [Anseongella sp.]
MKALTLGLFLIAVSAQWSFAQNSSADQEIIHLSKQKWQWMADKNVDSLAALFHEKAEFVHMGGNWGTDRELQVIESGGIWYKKADIHEVSVQLIDNTAILLNRITLLAEVGGNEVTN